MKDRWPLFLVIHKSIHKIINSNTESEMFDHFLMREKYFKKILISLSLFFLSSHTHATELQKN